MDLWKRFTNNPAVKMILLSLLVGIMAGLAALLFLYGLEVASTWFQGQLMQVFHPQPTGEQLGLIDGGESLGLGFRHAGIAWLVVLVPALGGLLSGLLCHRWAPEAEGHGIDAVIRAFHNNRGKIPVRVPLIKGLATCFTLGSGGSGGREGPIALIGSGLASWVAERFHLSVRDRRMLILAGAAGGIGAMFRAPLGGAVSAIEVLYQDDVETEALVGAVVSAVTAYSLFLVLSPYLFGFESPVIFAIPEITFQPVHLVFYLLLTFACATLGKLYVSVFHGIKERLFNAVPLNGILKPALGGLCVGLIALMVPQTLGIGMGYVQEALNFDPAATDLGPVIRFCIILILLKILTVSITMGSGGSGGVFGPCMLIGGLTGFTVGLLVYQLQPQFFPNIAPPSISAFVILGMAAFFAGLANAPLGALVMASEMTGGYALLAPLMLVSVLAMIFNRRDSIYHGQVKDKFHSPAHLCDISFEVLSNIKLADVYKPAEVLTVDITSTLAKLRKIISDDRYQFPLVVHNREGKLAGMLSLGTIREAMFDVELNHLVIVHDVMTKIVVAHLHEDLHTVLVKFTEHGYGRLPIVAREEPDKVLGYIAYQEVMDAYQKEIARLKSSE
ncbi:MAG: chloride channel protein [Acidobacteriota bacterium]|nr:chloride channel protein [Acidobacteriota bacterium]